MFRTVCFTSIDDALPLWQSGGDTVHGIAQSALWTKHWQQNVNPDCLVLALYIDEKPALLLPLEIIHQQRQNIARFIGGSHANCNFPVLFTASAAQISKEHIEALIDCLKAARPDIALVSLTRQMENWLGFNNPLLQLKHQLNANPVLIASLPDSFDAILERSNAARKRKKHRQHTRRYDETGEWRIYTAKTEAEVITAFDAFFAMKSHRFASQGIANSFAGDELQAFFHQLFADPQNDVQRQYRLHVLEVAGKPRAVISCAYWQSPSLENRPVQHGLTVEFGAFADDDLVTASPGDFLFHESIATAITEQLDYFSFGIGEEKYKRDWCDIELPLYDSHIALTLKGRLSASLNQLRSGIIYRIKTNRRLWPLVKKLRAKLRRS